MFTVAVFLFAFLLGGSQVGTWEVRDDFDGWALLIALLIFAASAAYIAHRLWPAL